LPEGASGLVQADQEERDALQQVGHGILDERGDRACDLISAIVHVATPAADGIRDMLTSHGNQHVLHPPPTQERGTCLTRRRSPRMTSRSTNPTTPGRDHRRDWRLKTGRGGDGRSTKYFMRSSTLTQ